MSVERDLANWRFLQQYRFPPIIVGDPVYEPALVNTNMSSAAVDYALKGEDPMKPPPHDPWCFMVYVLTTSGVTTYSELMRMRPSTAMRLLDYVIDRKKDEADEQERAMRQNGKPSSSDGGIPTW